jgi:serine/threonine-protein kinase
MLAFGAVVLTSGAAGAQTIAPADSAAAEALFQEGKKLLRERSFERACTKFAESFRLESKTGALLALARCHEEEGKWASAWAEYSMVVSRAAREGRPDRAKGAAERAARLEPRLSTLTIKVPSAVREIAGLEVRRDGDVVDQGSFDVAIPIDGGEHTVEASAPGRAAWQTRVSVAKTGDKQTIEIAELSSLPPAMPPPAAEAAAPARPADAASAPPEAPSPVEPSPLARAEAPPTSQEVRHSGLRVAGVAVGAAGLVGIGVGTFFGLRAMKRKDDAASSCHGDVCDPTGKQLRLDAISDADASTVAFVAGGVLMAAGMTMFLLGPRSAPARVSGGDAKIEAAPWLGPSGYGMAMRGTF